MSIVLFLIYRYNSGQMDYRFYCYAKGAYPINLLYHTPSLISKSIRWVFLIHSTFFYLFNAFHQTIFAFSDVFRNGVPFQPAATNRKLLIHFFSRGCLDPFADHWGITITTCRRYYNLNQYLSTVRETYRLAEACPTKYRLVLDSTRVRPKDSSLSLSKASPAPFG